MTNKYFNTIISSVNELLDSSVRFLIGFTQLFSNSYFTVVKFSGDVLGLLSKGFLVILVLIRALAVLAAVIVVGTSTYFTAKTFSRDSVSELVIDNEISDQSRSFNIKSDKGKDIESKDFVMKKLSDGIINFIPSFQQLLDNITVNLGVYWSRISESFPSSVVLYSGLVYINTSIYQRQKSFQECILYCFVSELLQYKENQEIVKLLQSLKDDLFKLSKNYNFSKFSYFEFPGIIGYLSGSESAHVLKDFHSSRSIKWRLDKSLTRIVDISTESKQLYERVLETSINSIQTLRTTDNVNRITLSIQLGDPCYNSLLEDGVTLYLDIQIDILGCNTKLFTARFIVCDQSVNLKKSLGDLGNYQIYHSGNGIVTISETRYNLLIPKAYKALALLISKQSCDDRNITGLFYCIVNNKEVCSHIRIGLGVITIFEQKNEKFNEILNNTFFEQKNEKLNEILNNTFIDFTIRKLLGKDKNNQFTSNNLINRIIEVTKQFANNIADTMRVVISRSEIGIDSDTLYEGKITFKLDRGKNRQYEGKVRIHELNRSQKPDLIEFLKEQSPLLTRSPIGNEGYIYLMRFHVNSTYIMYDLKKLHYLLYKRIHNVAEGEGLKLALGDQESIRRLITTQLRHITNTFDNKLYEKAMQACNINIM